MMRNTIERSKVREGALGRAVQPNLRNLDRISRLSDFPPVYSSRAVRSIPAWRIPEADVSGSLKRPKLDGRLPAFRSRECIGPRRRRSAHGRAFPKNPCRDSKEASDA